MPTTASLLEGWNIRPSAIFTSSCTRSATGSTPRTSTFSRPPAGVWKNGCTTSSGETSGSPFSSLAMPSKKRIAWKASSESWLEPSLVAPLRITTRLSGEPDDTNVRFRLAIRLQNSVVATTTRAITITVKAVRTPRASRLRQL